MPDVFSRTTAQKINDICQAPLFLATNGKTLVHLTTTPTGLLTKTSWFVTVDSLDSVLKVKPVLQTAQHMPKQMQELYTSKVKHTQTEQSKRRENR